MDIIFYGAESGTCVSNLDLNQVLDYSIVIDPVLISLQECVLILYYKGLKNIYRMKYAYYYVTMKFYNNVTSPLGKTNRILEQILFLFSS